MKAAVTFGVFTLALCTSSPTSISEPAAGSLPFDVGNGVGSQYGNYQMRPAGRCGSHSG
jgi:hypothetical protein